MCCVLADGFYLLPYGGVGRKSLPGHEFCDLRNIYAKVVLPLKYGVCYGQLQLE